MKLTIQNVLKDIEDEPVLPGEIPPDMKRVILKAMKDENVDFILKIIRIAVHETKKGIRERVLKHYLS